MVNATDRVDAPIEGSLVRAPSHEPGLDSTLPYLIPSKSCNSTQVNDHKPPLDRTLSHHPHFELPEGESAGQDHREAKHANNMSCGGGRQRSVVDIEHVPVHDDPREWSNAKKNFVMFLMISSVMGPMIAPSIYNPVLDEVKSQLNGTETQIGLTISLFILFQGVCPLFWASTAEIVGRKPVYLVSFILFALGSVVGSRATTMNLLIGMRCVQAMGSSAVLSVGAGSLADMYEIHQRGQKLGLYYGTPMMGPALGPLIGGALGSAYGWRSTMYFLACYAALTFILFIFFPDTWRRERSRVYQKAIEQALKRALKDQETKERKRKRKLKHGLNSNAITPSTTGPTTPLSTGAHTPADRGSVHALSEGPIQVDVDMENGQVKVKKRSWLFWRKKVMIGEDNGHGNIRPSIRDVNPLPTMLSIFRTPTNAIILFCSGLLFAAQYTTVYTASITFAEAPYNYDALKIGLFLFSFGIGNIVGSVVGGRYSDWMLRRLKTANNGVSVPEMRLKCTLIGMPFVIAGYLIYAWTAQFKTNVAGPAVALFIAGTSITLVYSSTLAYLVDANPGRSAPAVSCNSACRGVGACIMSQVAQPIRNSIGDGGLYTMFSGILLVSCCGLVLVAYVGERWRTKGVFEKKQSNDIEPSIDSATQSQSPPGK